MTDKRIQAISKKDRRIADLPQDQLRIQFSITIDRRQLERRNSDITPQRKIDRLYRKA